MIEESLTKLGMSPSEVNVYLHLLRGGPSYAKRMSAETRVNRTNVYEALDRLAAKGLVSSVVKNKVRWFAASGPGSLLSLADARADELLSARKVLSSDIRKLGDGPSKRKPLEAGVFTGKKGLRMVFEDIIAAGKPVSLMASQLQFREVLGHYFETWHRKRKEKVMRQRSIFPESLRGKLEKRELLEYRFVGDAFMSPTTTIIYGDCCVFVQWSGEPVAVRIQNSEIAKSHQNYFEMLWQSAKE
jgi:sugar-specific transcriptional regulator TrmB